MQGSRSRAASSAGADVSSSAALPERAGPSSSAGPEPSTSSSVENEHDASSNSYWAAKHHRVQRYIAQTHHDAEWYAHEKHVFVFSWAGRPIFCRYGDEDEIADLIGVMASFIANFQRLGDNIQAFVAGEWKFVFLFRGPIYLVCITRSPESLAQLQQQLHLTHQQIVSILSSSCHQILETHPSYDIRQLLSGAEMLIHDIINDSERQPALVFDSIPVLRLNRNTRSKITTALRKGPKKGSKKLLYALLLARGRLVAFHHERGAPLHINDMHLLTNFLTNSQSLRASDGWAPICLPNYDASGWLYAYVSFLVKDVCLAFVTSDPGDVKAMHEGRVEVAKVLEARDLTQDLNDAIALQSWTADDIGVGSPDLRHFLFRSLQLNQHVFAAPAEPYVDPSALDYGAAALFRRYRRASDALVGDVPAVVGATSVLTAQPSSKELFAAAAANTKHGVYFEVGQDAVVLGWVRPGDFELYATFLPLTSKEAALAASHRVLHWIKREEPNLFVTQ